MTTDEIEAIPMVCNGRPVVRGTRIAVEFFAGHARRGRFRGQVLLAYPTLTRAQVLALH